MGEPIHYKDMERFHVPPDFTPFDPRDEAAHRDRLQGFVDVVMDRINDLVDPQYQFGGDGELAERGSARFI
ncbi:MAG: hypothetical protein GY733_16385 [bacterium]|nr:hypothetical protein [bacterium]